MKKLKAQSFIIDGKAESQKQKFYHRFPALHLWRPEIIITLLRIGHTPSRTRMYVPTFYHCCLNTVLKRPSSKSTRDSQLSSTYSLRVSRHIPFPYIQILSHQPPWFRNALFDLHSALKITLLFSCLSHNYTTHSSCLIIKIIEKSTLFIRYCPYLNISPSLCSVHFNLE